MGERQQIYVITRVRSAGSGSTKHRCVAAYHVPQCQGTIALCCLLRFLAVVKHGSNREVIESEINALHEKYCSNEDLPAVCCPFITFLMAMCWSTKFTVPGNPDVGYSRYSPLDENVGSDGADNHQEITVIDLTSVRSPMYCFVNVAKTACNDEDGAIPPSRVPLSARQYLCAYAEGDLQGTGYTTKLDSVKLINLDALISVWPKEYKKRQTPQDVVSSGSEAFDFPISEEVRKLVGMSLLQSVAPELTTKRKAPIPTITITQDTHDTHDIEQMNELWQDGKTFQVYAALQELLPFPRNGMTLLHSVVEEKLSDKNGVLSLAEVAVRDDQVEEILNVHGNKIRRLDLSHNSYLTVQIVPKILQLAPHLKTLIILGCPLIANEDVYQLLRDNGNLCHSLEALLHHSLLQPLELARENAPYPIAFSYIRAAGTHSHPVACTLPLFQPSVIIRAILDLVLSTPDDPTWQPDVVLEHASAITPATLFSGFRKAHSENKEVTCIPQYSLRGLQGEGWVFALYTPPRVSSGDEVERDRRHTYAFVRFKPPKKAGAGEMSSPGVNVNAESAEIHTFRSWLDQLELEDQPAAPAELVQELDHRFLDLQLDIDNGLKPMLEDDLLAFVESIRANSRATMCSLL
ncbi:hypothetical protein DEU56DRAFT_917736 [Suillus clintonianus]|uniref:uncharacterized protein n=1 Tax=Suillus clintonianus TaxID=1904413 RepID=UPI001B85CBB5|nr:uncharacterized protein DEU56DRAFT_917736 [Suillus clintonianus]KAG2122563.1 hypothetical protein DEU56DRAFT_917736 [Suillus clintonianus]